MRSCLSPRLTICARHWASRCGVLLWCVRGLWQSERSQAVGQASRCLSAPTYRAGTISTLSASCSSSAVTLRRLL
eukprot:14096947-Alexandrium_andersonii.AAC.1